jgi:cell fate regulator YaaT (PSP1 superfamily)
MDEREPKSPERQRRRRRRRKPNQGENKAESDGRGSSGPGDRGKAPRQRRRRQRKGQDNQGRQSRPRPTTEDTGAVAHAAFGEVQPVMLPAEDFVVDDDDDEELPTDHGYGDSAEDSDEPAEAIELAPNLPLNPTADEYDPATAEVPESARFSNSPVANVGGIKFQPAGRIYLYDSGEIDYTPGEQVVVESDRGNRVATVAISSARRSHNRQSLKRVLRRPGSDDLQSIASNEAIERENLQTARDIARELRLNAKVFRAELGLSKDRVLIYFSAEEKVNTREFARRLTKDLACRVDLRQTGVRDEAKMVGGIGSCGQELCCTTWLPNFVPVSIKNAKDQGLVLNPTKVSGQCGRLKCCLIYEHSTYAELRQGMPKLGKRVVTDDGEGRVVELDILKQRIRVSLVDGDVNIYTKEQVKPLFPSQQPASKPGEGKKRRKRKNKPPEDSGSPGDKDEK